MVPPMRAPVTASRSESPQAFPATAPRAAPWKALCWAWLAQPLTKKPTTKMVNIVSLFIKTSFLFKFKSSYLNKYYKEFDNLSTI